MRWLAVAAGLASALALFPIFFLLYPCLLIVGGVIQPRFPSTGRWLAWAGAAESCVALITYDAHLLFPHPLNQPLFTTLTFPAATILVIWCLAELIADGTNRLRVRRSMLRAEPRPVGWGMWMVAAALNFVIVWSGYGLVSWHRQAGNSRISNIDLSTFCELLVTAVIIISFDVALARRVIQIKRRLAHPLGPSM